MAYELQDDQGNTISVHNDYDSAYAAAVEYAEDDGVVGHAGDLSEGGDRTLVWMSEEQAENDAGANAVASIRKSEDAQ